MDAHTPWKEVTYDSGDESACVGRDWLSGHGSGPVSPGGHHRLACRLDRRDPALRLASCWHLVAAQVQPWLAGRAPESLPTESKSLGQGVSLAVQTVLPCLAGSDAAGHREISLVAGASRSPGGRGNGSGGLVLSHLPDLPGKLVPVTNSASSARAG